MASLSRLAALDCVANAYPFQLTDHQATLLAWSDCLLRAERPSLKRVDACIAAMIAEFGINA